jgi:hypothetical protein
VCGGAHGQRGHDRHLLEIGRRIVEFEQGGEKRAEYGAELLETLAADLTNRFGRGFSTDNLESMRRFYRALPPTKISETLSRDSSAPRIRQTTSGKSEGQRGQVLKHNTARRASPRPGAPFGAAHAGSSRRWGPRELRGAGAGASAGVTDG